MATNIKITALTDITSANVTYNDLLAVVDMNGTPETKKGNLQLVGNLILNGAGGSYFAKAAQATNAETVSNAAQPAITSVGSLTAVTVTGNVDAGNVNGTAGVFTYVSGDGANLTNVPAGAATSITDGTSNVDIPTTDGNVTVGVGGTADVLIATSTGVNVTGTLNATGIITGDAGGISNVVYANVTGTPTLGNISTINIDGNVSNVLRGDGTFAADADTAYGDSNVVTLLNAFGSNTITTTGLVTGDGGGLSNVPYANVTGTPTLGNISTLDIDGSASNVLYGNGVFAAASSPALTGDGYQLSNITGANVSGEVSFAATANAVAGANVSGEVTNAATANAVAGANVSGEVGFSAVSNSVAGANVSGEVTFAATANAVAYANVSGTPTLGNISTIDIDGDAANVLYGNGVFAAATSPALTGDGYQLSNITGANVSGEVGFAAVANSVALANVSGAGNIASINIDGDASTVLYGNGTFAAISATTAQTVTTAAQPNITSTGTLTSLTVTGALGVTTGVITGDGGGISNVVAGNISGTVNNAVLAQEVINSAQPNIGSVGTLSALNVNDTIVSVGLTANTGDITVTAGVFAGDGGSISNVVGANVTGEVGFAAVANSVAIANVSGAGNIATVNLDGNTANYLDGTGSWGPVTATTATTAGTVTTAAQPNITSLGTLATLDVTGNISGGNINANTNGFAIGYKEIPPVVLSGNDTIALEDSGKHFRSTTAGNITLSIPTNATVAFPTGTAISIVEQAAGNILVNAISGVTLYHAGNSTAGNRVLSTYGVATLMKVDTDTWFISGTGVS
jgi:hypothetical protein